MSQGFVQVDTFKFKRLGSHQKKKARWHRPRGKQNKTRRHRNNYPCCPEVGHRTPRAHIHEIRGLVPVRVTSINELAKLAPKTGIVIAKQLGAKSRIELIKQAEAKGLVLMNIGGKK